MKRIVDLVFAFVAVVVIALAAYSVSRRKSAESVMCGNYMSSIGTATHAWALENRNFLPTNFVVMSNQLATTRVLICPGDRSRQPAKDWASFTPVNSSYALLTPGAPWNTTNAFLRCQIHGHLGYADGTVFDGKQRRTKVFFDK
jgi:hypothetical protein